MLLTENLRDQVLFSRISLIRLHNDRREMEREPERELEFELTDERNRHDKFRIPFNESSSSGFSSGFSGDNVELEYNNPYNIHDTSGHVDADADVNNNADEDGVYINDNGGKNRIKNNIKSKNKGKNNDKSFMALINSTFSITSSRDPRISGWNTSLFSSSRLGLSGFSSNFSRNNHDKESDKDNDNNNKNDDGNKNDDDNFNDNDTYNDTTTGRDTHNSIYNGSSDNTCDKDDKYKSEGNEVNQPYK
jgi:hypothetical protein